MGWTVDDSLYESFKIQKHKCENILETKRASLPDTTKCKILLRWSRVQS